MQSYDTLILESLNAKTPKEAFERIEEMRSVLEKWKQLAIETDMRPEDDCGVISDATISILDKLKI